MFPLSVAFLTVAAACGGSDDAASAPSATEASGSDEPTSTGTAASNDLDGDAPAGTAADTTTPNSAGAEYDFSAVGPIVEEFVADRGLNGAGLVVVERADGVVHEQYWGEFDADRVSLVASSSKMITAGVLLALDDQGVLDIDAPVADVVEWGSSNPLITPAQLLSNSSGLVSLSPNPLEAPYPCQYFADGTLQDCAESIFTTVDDDEDVIPPDTQFRYGGAQWVVAGAVAEAASGKGFADLVDEIFASPCGLDSLGFNNHITQIGTGFEYPAEFGGDPSTLMETDNPSPEGGAYIDPPDYGQLLLMHLRGGVCGDTQVLSPAALDVMHTDRIGLTYSGEAGEIPTTGEGTGYGMGWWVNRDTGRINNRGFYGSVPWLDLDDGYGAYLVLEADSGSGVELAGLLEEVIHNAVTG